MSETTTTRDTLELPPTEGLDAILDEARLFDEQIEGAGEALDGAFDKTALEGRAEIPSLARLHHERRVLARQLAPMAALFEGGQTPPAEAKRKQHRALIATLIATEQKLDGDKLESKLERLANADERHITFCEALDHRRVAYYEGRIRLMELTEAIRDREESLRVYGKEIAAGVAHEV